MVLSTWRDGSDVAVLRCAVCWKREGSEGHWGFALPLLEARAVLGIAVLQLAVL